MRMLEGLIALRQLNLEKAKAIQAKGDAENRGLTVEEYAEFEQLTGSLPDLDKKIAMHRNLEAAENVPLSTLRLSVPDSLDADAELKAKPNRERLYAVPKKHRATLKAFSGPDATDQAFRAGNWIGAAIYGNSKCRKFCEANGMPLIEAGMKESDDNRGGYLVPEELETTIINLQEKYGVFRRLAKRIGMTRETKNVIRRSSGFTMSAIGEGATVPTKEKQWALHQLNAKKFGGIAPYSRELEADALIDVADDLVQEFAVAAALIEDQCGFLGDGTSTYNTIWGVAVKINQAAYAGSLAVAATGHTSFATLTAADFENCIGKIPKYAIDRGNLRWVVSQYGWANSMQRIMDAVGGLTMAELANGAQYRFMGYPVEISQVLNSSSAVQVDTIKVLFGDFELGCLFGDRQGMDIQVLRELYAATDEIGVKVITRFDCVAHGLGDATTAGPIVALKTAAS